MLGDLSVAKGMEYEKGKLKGKSQPLNTSTSRSTAPPEDPDPILS